MGMPQQETQLTGRTYDPRKVTFGMFTNDDVRKMSVVKIVTPLSLNALGYPLIGGLYDPAMGPMHENSEPCKTCMKNVFGCPGHIGHIELPVPATNPLFYKPVTQLMRLSCLSCYQLQILPAIKWQMLAQLQLAEAGFISEALDVELTCAFEEGKGTTEAEEIQYKEKVFSYVQGIIKNKQPAVQNVNRAVEAIRNLTVANLMKISTPERKCLYCKSPLSKFLILKDRISVKVESLPNPKEEETSTIISSTGSSKSGLQSMNPKEMRDHLRKLWKSEKVFLSEVFPILQQCNIEFPVDIFFFDVIPVTPTNVRPVRFVRGKPCEHPQTQLYKKILSNALVLRSVLELAQTGGEAVMTSEEVNLLVESARGSTPIEKLHFTWEALQMSVDLLLDSKDMSNLASGTQGLKQVLEKKTGVIRMHIMGKRVNYAARSVITPDPNINVDEIGLPEAFATKLTYPVNVTPWNVKDLRQMVINGPNVYPGAVMVADEKGNLNRIDHKDQASRESIAKRLLTPGVASKRGGARKVYRHLLNGDILLLNRQPTLHRPSIMAHKARILKGEKTLRMHYSNCKSYNADFDGDEMNAHFPQSELARSEAYNLVNVCQNYLVPKDGTPLGGLIQDHMVSGVWLSTRGQFFSHEDYSQLVYQAIGDSKGKIKLLPPAMLKPKPLWSGKQIISTVVINTIPQGKPLINMISSAKIKANLWVRETPRVWKAGGTPFSSDQEMSEGEVIFRQGELLCGVLDKTHYGATPYGLIHCMYELYGGECSSHLLSAFSKLFTMFLQRIQGFTLGVEDILVMEKADQKRSDIVQECRRMGDSAVTSALGLPLDTSPDVLTQKMEEAYCDHKRNFRGEVDSQYKSLLNPITDSINKTCLPAGLLQKFPDNNLQLMVQSGAKGSTVNTMQISGLLGQIELEGKRPPLMISGRSLPSFRPYDRQPRAGGFIDGRFMTGIQPQEFFFHCMAGREGLIDTAVKTSRSGYLQRCLVKSLEGLTIQYDGTVRDSDGSVIQFEYGEDGMDVSKVQFLNPNQMAFLEANHNVVFNRSLLSTLKSADSSKEVVKYKKKLKKWKKKHENDKVRRSTFLNYTVDMKDAFKVKKLSSKTGRKKGLEQLIDLYHEACGTKDIEQYIVDDKPLNPVPASFSTHSYFGSVSESLDNMIDAYLSERSMKSTTSMDNLDLRDMLHLKSMCSLAPPGEPVGLLAAQSVGEPSTQMTLNTFHFAGRGEMNVTLGIPRLKEILMTASKNISTPSMEIPFRKDVSDIQRQSAILRGKLTKVTVADVLETVSITETLVLSPVRCHQYVLKMKFLPYEFFRQLHSTTPDAIVRHVETRFLSHLIQNIKKILSVTAAGLSTEGKSKKAGREQDNGEVDDDVDGDLLAVAAKSGTGEEHESSDEEALGADDDATTAMHLKRHHDSANYSDDSEDENSNNESDSLEGKDLDRGKTEICDIIASNQYVKDYYYDQEKKEWIVLKLSLPISCKKINLSQIVQDVAHQSAVNAVNGLKKAFLINNPRDGLVLKTDGLNIIEMFKYSNLLDLNKLYSNDVHAIAGIYGIEAAVKIIVREIREVFKVYGIGVDSRHLMLIADFMTFSGMFLPMSRTGMEYNPSALQKMSFEAPIGFLKKSVWLGKSDTLQSPSSRLFMGRPCKTGTGTFELRHQLMIH